MKLVIEIPDHIYEHAKNVSEDSYDEWDAMRAIARSVALAKLYSRTIFRGTQSSVLCVVSALSAP